MKIRMSIDVHISDDDRANVMVDAIRALVEGNVRLTSGDTSTIKVERTSIDLYHVGAF